MNNRFSSTSYHGLDAKNRIFIPVGFRDSLGEVVYVFRQKGATDNCLRLYTAEHFEKLAQKYNDMEDEALTVEEIEAAAEISRSFFGYVDDLKMDKQGRITLSAIQLKHAGIEGEVAIIGMGNRIEVWNRETWDKKMGYI